MFLEIPDSVTSVLNKTTMEELFHRTRPGFTVDSCQMGSYNCKFDWKVVGTIQGMCLAYVPTEKYPRDVELRVTLSGNTSGIRQETPYGPDSKDQNGQ